MQGTFLYSNYNIAPFDSAGMEVVDIEDLDELQHLKMFMCNDVLPVWISVHHVCA